MSREPKPVISGPYLDLHHPWGKTINTSKRWWVEVGEETIGSIVVYDSWPERFVINNSWPTVAYGSLKEAIQALVKMNASGYVFPT